MTAPTTPPALPASVVVPEDWWKIQLHPVQRRQSAVRALVAAQFRGIDDQPIARRALEQELLEVADEAAEQYGAVLYVSRQTIAGLPVSVSLVVRVLPKELGSVQRLRETFSGTDQIDIAELPAGRCLRRIREVEPARDGYQEAPASFTADYWLDLPEGAGLLQLTYATPLAMVAEAWTELFDAVTSTVRWSP